MPAVAMPPAALMMAWNFLKGVRDRLRRLRVGERWWPRLRSGILTWECVLVYGVVPRPRPLLRLVVVAYVLDGLGWWGGVAGGRVGGVDGVRSMIWASREMIQDWIAPG